MARHHMPSLKLGSPGDAERRARAAVASGLASQRSARIRAYTARDERADLLASAADGCLKSQVRCLKLYGKHWQRMAADLASKREQREDAKS